MNCGWDVIHRVGWVGMDFQQWAIEWVCVLLVVQQRKTGKVSVSEQALRNHEMEHWGQMG